MSRRSPKRRKYTQCVLDSTLLAPVLHEVMTIGDGATPVEVVGWFLAGSLRRVRADYPNGWRLQFSLSEAGYATRISASMHLTVRQAAA